MIDPRRLARPIRWVGRGRCQIRERGRDGTRSLVRVPDEGGVSAVQPAVETQTELIAEARNLVDAAQGDEVGCEQLGAKGAALLATLAGREEKCAVFAYCSSDRSAELTALNVGRFAGAMSRNATWILCACASRNATQCDKANSQAGRKFFSRGHIYIARVTVTISTPQTTFVLQDQSAKERKYA